MNVNWRKTIMKQFLTPLLALCLATAQAQVTADRVPQQSVQARQPVQTAATPHQEIVRETIRFGYLSYEEALRNMPGYEAAQKQIADMHKAYEQELQHNKEQFSKQFAEYVEGQQTFPENILRKRQKELEQLMEGSLSFKEEARQLLAQKEEEVMKPLRERLATAIHNVGMERNYAFVVNIDNNAYPFINGGIGDDITADVMKILAK